jgi:hypothetical protein
MADKNVQEQEFSFVACRNTTRNSQFGRAFHSSCKAKYNLTIETNNTNRYSSNTLEKYIHIKTLAKYTWLICL